MLKRFIKISSLVCVIGLLASCGTDPVADPAPTPDGETEENTLTLKFKTHFDGESVDFDVNQFVTSSMDSITPTKLRFLMSDIRMVKMDNTELTFTDEFGLVSFEENKTSIVLPAVPQGSYQALRFNIGLDSNTNHGDPSKWPVNHALNVINNGMHWGWAGGYIFMAHEGKYLNKGKEDSYTFHIANLNNANEIEIPLVYSHNSGENDIIEVSADLSKYFDGVNAFSLIDDIPASHSSPLQQKYIDKLKTNIKEMFVAKKL